jgi:diacylglycerol kinase (ATP)
MQPSSDLLTSFRHAFSGVWYVVRTQRNARIHLTVALVVIALGLWLGLSYTEWAVIVLTIGLVLAAEAFNTVAEAVVDLATAERHPLAKIAKDVAAGAVLLMAITAVLVGLLILGPPLWRTLLATF